MKNTKNQNIAIFVSIVVVTFFFLFGQIFFKMISGDVNTNIEKNDINLQNDIDLSFVDMSLGQGERTAVSGDTVSLNFVLKSPTGDTIASSLDSGPVIVLLGKDTSLSGLDKSIIGMKVSGKRVVVIPAMYNYAYTQNGPVNSDTPLIFEVELVSIK